jgi:tetratricopeptide (TPR) repeat protein
MPRAKASGSANADQRVERRRRQEAPVNPADALERGRQAYARRAWREAWESLSLADRTAPLGAEDVELLGTSAYMLGRGDDLESLERAYHLHLDAGEALHAARCAFWMGMSLSIRGEVSRATGWLGRAQRLVERERGDCVERGYLLLPLIFEHESAGAYEAAATVAADAAEIGERFRDADLFALAVQSQGILLVRLGRVAEGLGLMDEAMVAVTAGELSPIVSGMVYCGVILGCQEAYELRRAREWTAALTHWCEEQPDLVSFTGTCLVHRAEILQLQGAWREALEEARRAVHRCEQAMNKLAAAHAIHRQGEVHRLQGDFAAAEMRAKLVVSRSLGWLSCGWLKETAPQRPPRSAGRWAKPSRGQSEWDYCLPMWRSCWPSAISSRLASRATSWRRLPPATRATCLGRSWSTHEVLSSWPEATPRLPWSRCGAQPRCGRSSRRRTKPHARACSSDSRAAPWETTTRPRWSWRPPGASSSSSERRRTSPASTRSPRPRTLPTLVG